MCRDGALTEQEFSLLMHVSTLAKEGHTLPARLANDLIDSAATPPRVTVAEVIPAAAPTEPAVAPPRDNIDSDDSDDEVSSP